MLESLADEAEVADYAERVEPKFKEGDRVKVKSREFDPRHYTIENAIPGGFVRVNVFTPLFPGLPEGKMSDELFHESELEPA